MNTQYRKNLKSAMTACKNYTDQKAEEILWQLAENDVSTSDDNTTASTKTVPSNATRCKIKRIYGLTQKFNPTTAYDDTSYMIKTMPSTVYDFDVSKVDGKSEVSENLAVFENETITSGGVLFTFLNGVCNSSGTPSGTGWIRFKTITLNAGSYAYADLTSGSSKLSLTDANYQAKSSTFTLSETTTLYWSITGNAINNAQLVNSKPMLVSGSTAPTEFSVGYTGIHNFAWTGVKVEGANLCNPNVHSEYSINSRGTYSVSDDTITIENTSSNNTNYGAYIGGILEAGTYYYKFVNVSGLANATNLRIVDSTTAGSEVTLAGLDINGGTFTIAQKGYFRAILLSGLSMSFKIIISKTNIDYEPYVSQTIPIDLSSILYNGSPLFEGNSLKAVGTAKDYITPYKAHKQMGKIVLNKTDYSWTLNGNGTIRYINNLVNIIKKESGNSVVNNILCDKLPSLSWNNIYNGAYTSGVCVNNNENGLVGISVSDYENLDTLTLYYELATPIEVSIDWSATLRHITGYSNGTITLLNTNNQDTDNTITYNSIIKENCCAKIVQSRGGNVVKTINLPTQASDGYSAGSVNNYRDLTTSKRIGNVGTQDLSLLSYNYNSGRKFYLASLTSQGAGGYSNANAVCKSYDIAGANYIYNDASSYDMKLGINANQVYLSNQEYTDATSLTSSMINDILYYELADASKTETSIDSVDNVIEVEPSDVLSFYDENDNLVTVPSDLTYRIEVVE